MFNANYFTIDNNNINFFLINSDLEKLKQKEESQQNVKQDLSSQSQAMMSLNIQLQSTVMKAQAKAIDLELRKLDAMQATDKLSYIQVNIHIDI